MESSCEPEESKQKDREEKYFLLSPCYLFEQVFKSFLKCFGYVSSSSTNTTKNTTSEKYHDDIPSPARGSKDHETETKPSV